MAHNFRNSPFVASTSGLNPLDTRTDISGGEPTLDHLGESSLGELYWNNGLATMGLVCGAADKENHAIVQRLLSSHLRAQAAVVLIIHTDHFSLASTRCLLLHPRWRPVRVLVSPDADEELTGIYNLSDELVSPIAFKDNSITLRDVLALFTPPSGMQGSSAILGTVQLIVSQLRPPFDLQRFIELVDQEKWSEEGANFMALRQTLLTKLLSPAGDNEIKDTSGRVTLIDLTDPILQSTGLDSSIMVIAMRDFIRSTPGKKIIVLNNCQQYLYHSSSLTKTLESLVAQGNDRPTTILLSTTDPTVLSSPVLRSLDYAIFGSSCSLSWSEFLHKHFTKQALPKAQSRVGRAMIWSPASSIHALNNPNGDYKGSKAWGEILSFIDIPQFEQSTPSTPVPNNPSNATLVDGHSNGSITAEKEIVNQSTAHETASETLSQANPDEEEGIISLDKMGLEEPFNVATDAILSFLSSFGSVNEELTAPKTLTTKKPSQPNEPVPVNKIATSTKLDPLLSAVSQLCDGEVGILVDFEAVRQQLGKGDDINRLGWTTFTQLVKAACDSKVVELIEGDPGSKYLALLPSSYDRINTSTSSPASNPRSPSISRPNEEQPPLQAHRVETRTEPSAEAMLDLREGFKTRSERLGHTWVNPDPMHSQPNPPGSSSDTYSQPTFRRNSTAPPSQAIHTMSPSSKPAPESKSPHPSPSEMPLRALQRILVAGDFPLKHRAVVSIIINLINGIPRTKVRKIDLIHSLRSEYRGAKEDFLFSLIVKAEEDHVLECETDREGVAWAVLRDLSAPDFTGPNFKSYPTSHHAVVSVIQNLASGGVIREVHMDLVHSELRSKGHAATMQGAADLTTAATAAHVMRVQRDEEGERFAILEDPKLSGGFLIPKTDSENHPVLSKDERSSPVHGVATDPSLARSGNQPHSNLPPSSMSIYPEQYANLISAILKASGGPTGMKVPLSRVRNEMGEKTLAQEMLKYGWATLEQWLQGACLERYTQRGGMDWVMLNVVTYAALQNGTRLTEVDLSSKKPVVEKGLPLEERGSTPENKAKQKPSEISQTAFQDAGYTSASHPKDTTLAEGSKSSTFSIVNASDYPFKHRPVVSTILKLTGGVFGAKVRMVDFTASLQLDFPHAREDFLTPLVHNAEMEGVLTREKDDANVLWAALQTPATLHSSPAPSNQLLPAPHPQTPPPPTPPPASLPTHLARPASSIQSQPLKAVDFPLKHRAVVSIVIKLTNGVHGRKVRMTDLTDSLRSEYRGAKEDFLFSLVVKAEEDRVLERETDREGVAWAFLTYLSAPDASESNARSNPTPHHAVISVIQSLASGGGSREVHLDLVHRELCSKGHAATIQGAMEMTTAAAGLHFIRVQRDEEGERYAILQEKEPEPSKVKRSLPRYTIWNYPSIYRPVISAIFKFSHGRWGVRVKTESVIDDLMTDTSGNHRDAEAATSLVFDAADAKVIQCNKDAAGIWWSSVEAPV